MKNIVFIITTICFLTLNSCSKNFEILPEEKVDLQKIEKAKKFADEFLSSLRNDRSYTFKNEAIILMKMQLSSKKQKAIYENLKSKFGDYQTIDYAETWIKTGNSGLLIFRFKGKFEKSENDIEIRVVLNRRDKIAGLWIRPWFDILSQ